MLPSILIFRYVYVKVKIDVSIRLECKKVQKNAYWAHLHVRRRLYKLPERREKGRSKHGFRSTINQNCILCLKTMIGIIFSKKPLHFQNKFCNFLLHRNTNSNLKKNIGTVLQDYCYSFFFLYL